MRYKDFDELLQVTGERIDYVNQFQNTPDDKLLLSLYKGIKEDFEHNLELVMLDCDYKIEKKQMKYMLRKTKNLRAKSWRLYFANIRDNYFANNLDLYKFDYHDSVYRVRNIPLYSGKTLLGVHLRNKENLVSERREPSDNSESEAVTELDD